MFCKLEELLNMQVLLDLVLKQFCFCRVHFFLFHFVCLIDVLRADKSRSDTKTISRFFFLLRMVKNHILDDLFIYNILFVLVGNIRQSKQN